MVSRASAHRTDVLRSAIPIIHVTSARAAVSFYVDALGFRELFAYRPGEGDDPCYYGLQRDDSVLHVSSFGGDSVAGAAILIGTDDIDALYEELNGRVPIALAPTDQTWGTREM